MDQQLLLEWLRTAGGATWVEDRTVCSETPNHRRIFSGSSFTGTVDGGACLASHSRRTCNGPSPLSSGSTLYQYMVQWKRRGGI